MADAPEKPGSPVPHDLALQKLGLEVDKLRAEVRHLRFPNLGWMTALLTVVVSTGGLGLQCARSDREYQAAALKKERTELDLARLEVAKGRLDTLIQLTNAALDSLHRQRDDVKAQVARAQASLTEAEHRLASGAAPGAAANSEAQTALAAASQEVTKLGAAIQQTATRAAQTRDTLNIIQAEIAAPGGLSPGSPIIITFQLPSPASITYRRWISRDVESNLGSFGAGQSRVRMPYGGYMYFQATYTSGRASLQSADCRRDCTVTFE